MAHEMLARGSESGASSMRSILEMAQGADLRGGIRMVELFSPRGVGLGLGIGFAVVALAIAPPFGAIQLTTEIPTVAHGSAAGPLWWRLVNTEIDEAPQPGAVA